MRNKNKNVQFCTFELCIKMSYYWFNRQETLQIAKEIYSKKNAAKYYLQNKETIKENQESVMKTYRRRKKTRLRSISMEQVQYKEETLKNK